MAHNYQKPDIIGCLSDSFQSGVLPIMYNVTYQEYGNEKEDYKSQKTKPTVCHVFC